jgi:hypothetical protein
VFGAATSRISQSIAKKFENKDTNDENREILVIAGAER